MTTATSQAQKPADRLRELRTDQGLSQRELAYFAGCSNTAVSRIEQGRLEASAALKARLARALGVTVAALWTDV